MGQLQHFITPRHTSTPRDYSLRNTPNKAELAAKAKQFSYDYWDNTRQTGYGGYIDDGRWQHFAQNLITTYKIESSSSVLDIGCGKGFLLSAFKKKDPTLCLAGLDISKYAIDLAPDDIKSNLIVGNVIDSCTFKKKYDYIFSLNTLHNLKLPDLFKALSNIQNQTKKKSYIVVESYRNEEEKWNLLQWQLTCECFYSPEEWLWIFNKTGYSGDYEFIYFE